MATKIPGTVPSGFPFASRKWLVSVLGDKSGLYGVESVLCRVQTTLVRAFEGPDVSAAMLVRGTTATGASEALRMLGSAGMPVRWHPSAIAKAHAQEYALTSELSMRILTAVLRVLIPAREKGS